MGVSIKSDAIIRAYHTALTNNLTTHDRASSRQRFDALCSALRDAIAPAWLKSQQAIDSGRGKTVCYFSIEFLIGRALRATIENLGALAEVRSALEHVGLQLDDLIEEEADPGLGNGGLGRLAACFLDSLACLNIQAIGYGLRFDYGMFSQEIRDGQQYEVPDPWSSHPDPWELTRLDEKVIVPFACSVHLRDSYPELVAHDPGYVLGIPVDRPIVGYAQNRVNTLRLWTVNAPQPFSFDRFSAGDIFTASAQEVSVRSLVRLLYPNDATAHGKVLRFAQEYLLVVCSVQDIVRRFRRLQLPWEQLPERFCIQLNDTHPTLAIAELMRYLLDEQGLPWELAWSITRATCAYTNHTLLPEALESWPTSYFDLVCPRLLSVIYEINHHILDGMDRRAYQDAARDQRISLIDEGEPRKVRMANLAVVGTHSVNGVAKIHSQLVKSVLFSDFAKLYPDRFQNKTNGVSHRRWLLGCNPKLSEAIRATIGGDWMYHPEQLRNLVRYEQDVGFHEELRRAKFQAKERLVSWIGDTLQRRIPIEAIFDSHCKRFHLYKRQLLNLLHVLHLFLRIRDDARFTPFPRVFFFSGKAASSYVHAKWVIKFVHLLSEAIASHPRARHHLSVVFIPDYSVTIAERLIAASDISEQLSTAGYEASGTGNMKFMMNGALTIGTRDGATIEMAEEAGEDALLLFGLTAEEVERSRGWYSPAWHYAQEPEVRQVLDALRDGSLVREENAALVGLHHLLLEGGDHFMHLADFRSYTIAHARSGELYQQSHQWQRLIVRNIAASGHFSSDRTIREYARDIWRIVPPEA